MGKAWPGLKYAYIILIHLNFAGYMLMKKLHQAQNKLY